MSPTAPQCGPCPLLGPTGFTTGAIPPSPLRPWGRYPLRVFLTLSDAPGADDSFFSDETEQDGQGSDDAEGEANVIEADTPEDRLPTPISETPTEKFAIRYAQAHRDGLEPELPAVSSRHTPSILPTCGYHSWFVRIQLCTLGPRP